MNPVSIREISELEARIYARDRAIIKGPDRIAGLVCAAYVASASRGCPSLCYEFRDVGGVLRGYVISLVGDAAATKGKYFVPKLEQLSRNTRCIYVSDWQTDQRSAPNAGGQLAKAFLTDYGRFFISKGDLRPIVTHARVGSAFEILVRSKRTIEKIVTKSLRGDLVKGTFLFDLKRVGEIENGEDRFVGVVLHPILQ